jgi:(1->4)-alpha-D-glucan 1-alpha-D-glucosylmutase
MHIPSATYRIQLNKDFTFAQLQEIIDYLHQLGITTIYASPVTTASPGSTHGYDVSDPHSINPEIGTLSELKTIANKLAAKNMSWLQDIVPNHMAFTPSNQRLMDVLERDAHSPYYRFFDINLLHPATDLNGKLMVPFLGSDLESCINNEDIKLSFSDQGFCVNVYDSCYPLSIGAYYYLAAMVEEAEQSAPVYNSIKSLADKGASGLDYEQWIELKQGWVQNCMQHPALCNKIGHTVNRINNDKEKMLRLLQQQHYTLTPWQRSMWEINYRRFFTVNSLICLRMEEEMVFNEYHRFLHGLSSEGIIHGLRIDHIDGLYDPTQYIDRLRHLFGEEVYIIAEKILEASENIPSRWKLNGTSGYEFLAYTNRLLTSSSGSEQLQQIYRELVPGLPAYDELVTQNKTLILENYMAGEWENLVRQFFELQLQQNFQREKMKQAIAALMIALPVYRIYPDNYPLQPAEDAMMQKAFEKAKQIKPECTAEIEHLQNLYAGGPADERQRINFNIFLKRLMQFTGPLTAKGVEDTSFYVYNPLISHNEVGDAPSVPAITVDEFHTIMQARQQHNPLSLNATSTHDTKRGEDARMRINLLSELSTEWQQKIKEWFAINQPLHQSVKGQAAPSANDEYFIYQSIIGAWHPPAPTGKDFVERLEAFMTKAVREAKVNSNWGSPNTEYENACTHFIRGLFYEQHAFLRSIQPFAEKVAEYASIYSLAQTVIKIAAPGIPDIYQGCELWDLSFVDPDNRRAIDYAHRKEILSQLIEKEKEGNKALIAFIKENWKEGYEKLFVTWKMLRFRRNDPKLFTQGDYFPITIAGKETEAIAFARQFEDRQIVVVTPLGIVNRYMNRNTMVKKWTGSVQLPVSHPGQWRNIFTGESFISGGQMALQDIFQSFPVAVLEKV